MVQLDQKTPRNTAIITIVSCIPSISEKPPEIWKLLWGHLPEKKLCVLQKIQDRAFHLIESAAIKDRIPSARLDVEKIITYDRSIMVHKILKEMCPENLKGKLTRRNKISKYVTRRINDLQYPNHSWKSQKRVFRMSVQRSRMLSQTI